MDLSDIPYGADFRRHIQTAFHNTDLLLAAIGPKWLGQEKDSAVRIHHKEDPVRAEIQTALRKRILIIPVLVDGAKMPNADELPRSIKDFAFRNAVTVDSGIDFRLHMDRLTTSVDQALGLEGRQSTPADSRAERPWPNPASIAFAASPAVLATTTRSVLSRLLSYFAVPVVLLLVAHYLLVIKWDLDTVYLRPFAIIIPLVFGFLSFKNLHLGIGLALLLGSAVAVAAVAGMMTVVGWIDQHSILPQSEAGWQEAVEFVVTIALATTAGNLLGRLADATRLSRRRPF